MKKIIVLIFTLVIMILPSYSLAKENILQPYDAYMSIKASYPEFGNKPWEKTRMLSFVTHKKHTEKKCAVQQKKFAKQEQFIREKLKQKKLEEQAEKSLVSMEVPQIDDYKTWMSYTSVTSAGSPQYYLLNHEKAYTDKNNYRKIGDYYCVALGSFYSTEIGTRFRITFDNGQSIKVILGDQKADRHTDGKHQYSSSGNILEFIMGSKMYENQNTINTMFPSGVAKIEKYTNDENVFE